MRGLAWLVLGLGLAATAAPAAAQWPPSGSPSMAPSVAPSFQPLSSPSAQEPLVAPAMPPPPPPVLPDVMAPRPTPSSTFALERCVATLGQVGCAARLYAQLLCDNIGLQTPLSQLHQSLQTSFEQAAIDFQGVTPASIETAAVRYYTPQLCPLKSEKIIDLMQRQGPASQAHSLP